MRKLLYIASSAAFAMLIGLAICSFMISPGTNDIPINATIMILGTSLGWLCGTFITPYNEKESEYVSSFTKLASVFFSGYVIGKMDRVVEYFLSPDIFFDTLSAFRPMSFLASFVIALMLTYIYRQYYLEQKS